MHICKLGVLYQVFGKVLVTGIFPKNSSFVLTFQYPKLGIEITTDLPILKSSLKLFQDYKKPVMFDLELHNQKIDLEIDEVLFQHFLELLVNLYEYIVVHYLD